MLVRVRKERDMKKFIPIFRAVRSVFACSPAAAAVGVSTNFLFALCAAGSVWAMAEMLKRLEAGSNIVGFAAIFFGFQILRRLLNIVSDLSWNVGVDEKCRFRLGKELSRKAASIPYIWLEDAGVLDKLKRASDCVNDSVLSDIFYNILTMAECVLTIIGLLSVMAGYSVWYLPLLLAALIPYLFSRIQMGRDFYRLAYYQASRTRKRDYFFSLFQDPKSQKEQRVIGFGGFVQSKWETERKKVAEETLAFRKKDSKRLEWFEGLGTASYIVCILLSFLMVVCGHIAIGVFGAGIFAFKDAQDATKSLFALMAHFFEEAMEADNYYSFFDLPDEGQGGRKTGSVKGDIEVRNVSFTYPQTSGPAVDKCNLEIAAGESVAIVGENGSGKSTLCKVLLGLYRPDEGEVLIDGVNIEDYAKAELASQVSAVAQDYCEYHLPPRVCVGLHSPEAAGSDKKLKEVLSQVGLGRLAESQELDRWLGREFDGQELSGGQWQRLALAGALDKDCSLLFLDEPTSALDPSMEYDMMSQFIEAGEGKTCIIVSHRTGLCRMVDKVVFMEKGRISGVGPHDVLMKQNKAYASFFLEQAKWYRK